MVATFPAVDVLEQLASFFFGDATEGNPVGTLAVHLPVVDGVGLGLPSYALGFCVIGREYSLQDEIGRAHV